jgi:pantetheine-phosphate adenylyltransferase
MKLLVGLTGGIGAGKSSVARILAQLAQVVLVDTDSLAKEIAGRPEHQETITSIIGCTIDINRSEDRARLAQLLFNNPKLLKQYEAFIHPLVWNEVRARYAAVPDQTIFVVESAVLNHACDRLVVVTCTDEVRITRLRDGVRAMNESDIRARIARQVKHATRLATADHIIDNSSTEAELKEKVLSLYEQLQQLITVKNPVMETQKTTTITKALFVGSFDPPTLGHQWLITEALNRYDEVAIAVTVNSAKKSMFTLEERFNMLREIVPAQVSVGSFSDVYSVDYAESIDANVLVRGIRNDADREYENVIARINSQINPSVRTEFLEAPPGLADISSSMVKMMIGPRGWEYVASQYVAPEVLVRLIAKQYNLFRKLEAHGAHGNEIEFWKQLVLPYVTEPNRDYHNLAHISAMLAEFKTVESLCSDPVAVEYAIWMHDIVNDTMVGRHINEERSAERALRLADFLGLPQDFCEKVRMLILATKHDRTVGDGDAQLLIDMDLAILGANPRVFQEYEDNVRKEYAWMHEEPLLDGRATDVFNSRRLDLLRAFYVRKHLYHTEHFRTKYEQVARRNLEASIQKLAQTIK